MGQVICYNAVTPQKMKGDGKMLFWKSDSKKDNDNKKKKSPSDKNEKKSRPWYDIRDDDLLEFDMMDDD